MADTQSLRSRYLSAERSASALHSDQCSNGRGIAGIAGITALIVILFMAHTAGAFGGDDGGGDGGCCSGIEEFESGFGSGGTDIGGGDGVGGLGNPGDGDGAGGAVRRLFEVYPATDQEVALQMLMRFREMDDDPLAYLTESPKVCGYIGGCVGLDDELVQSMARLAYGERRNFTNNLPAWGSFIVALLALFLSLVSLWRSRSSKQMSKGIVSDHASARPS